ncbi:pro-neuregulin-1, membrane-bound isoform isoform X9 [Varanus komodoensis]|uniref:pro-neuregulin-1, membrane-bound isoform isoform X9 n=1 Tax=Varanus komodoensis TaxID=61221 RepID=UPI001CF779D3|nr:pro-neuregulin-1, membrane-bound isoform isoform X9 [Varanus komodoensis]
MRGAAALDMSEARRATATERGAATAASSSPLEGPEKKRKVKKGKGGAGRRGSPRDDSGPAVPPKLKEMKSQESAVGQTLVLRCEASSEHSSLKFKWLKNGKEITKRNRPENIKIKSPKKQKTFSELRISRASLTDAGEYTCKASNRFGNNSTKAQIIITDINDTSTSTTGTSHLTRCDVNKKGYCVNGGECFMVKDLPNPRYLCKCPNEFTGDRCQNYVMASFYSTSTSFLSLPE